MRTRRFLSLALVLVSLLAARAETPVVPSARPSVLFIAVDGLGLRLGCYGADVKTPNLDRLARLGRRFDRAYCQYPASGPSRASILTGWRPDKTGVFDPPEDRIDGAAPLQERFHTAGYFTARIGRVFNGPGEDRFKWDLAEAPPEADLHAARRLAQLIEAHKDKPFFIAAGLNDAVSLASPTVKRRTAAVVLPKDEPVWGDLPAIAISPSRVPRPGRVTRPVPLPRDKRRQRIAVEQARAELVDAQLGVVLEALDRLNLWDRVAVVLVGDHGSDLGEHGDLRRGDTLFEESLRVPLIVAAPGMKEAGTPARALVELVDLYPTLIETCGLKKLSGIDGASLVPLLQDPTRSTRTAVVSMAEREAGYLGRSVRTDRYRYTEWPDGSQELYDHDADPHEWTNLALGASGAERVRPLKQLLDERETTAAPPPARPAPSRASTKPPNVLLIVLDDLSVRLGCYGYDVKTPNIDRLAGRGRRFDRAYCQVPMCSPSRTSLMSGWRPERMDLWTNAIAPREHIRGAVPLQEHFHANGYYTAHVGKIYHGDWEKEFAWDLAEYLPPQGPKKAAEDDESKSAAQDNERAEEGGISSWWQATDDKDEEEPDGLRARRIAQLLGQRRSGPFFIAAGFAKPHMRWVAPRKYFDMYPPDQMQFVDDPVNDGDDIPLIAITKNTPIPRPGLFLTAKEPEFDDASRRRAIAAHNACVTFVDAQVGVILDAMDRLKLWDSTVVVLLGDNGFHLGEHRGLWRKDTLFEESTRVPLIIAAPGMKKRGVASREIVEFIDVYPTLVDLARLPTPAGVQGTSLLPLLQDPAAKVKAAAFSFRSCAPPRLGRSVRTEQYRFTEWPDGSRELYDLAADAGERKNLARDPAQGPTIEAMKKRLYPPD